MTDAFVGFNQSPKPDPRAKLQKHQAQISFDFELRELLARFTSPSGFESIFGKTKKFDFRQGAKLQFSLDEIEFRGTISQINIPKRIVLNTEIHGEMEFQFSTASGPAKVIVIFRSNLVPEAVAEWEDRVTQLLERFRKV